MKTIFLVIFGAGLFIVSQLVDIRLGLADLIILGLACIRLARTISFNTVAEPLRRPFCEVKPDDCGAGENVHPKGSGWRYAIGELLSCPICTGTWSALILVAVWSIAPAIVYVLAVAGASELLHWGMEMLEWEGRKARCTAGLISPDKRS